MLLSDELYSIVDAMLFSPLCCVLPMYCCIGHVVLVALVCASFYRVPFGYNIFYLPKINKEISLIGESTKVLSVSIPNRIVSKMVENMNKWYIQDKMNKCIDRSNRC